MSIKKKKMELRPIGIIHSPFKQARGTPTQPSYADGAEGRVEIFPEYAAGLKDLKGFERIWLVYWFDRAAAPQLQVRPYMDERERGLFATRAPCRPNPIGISSVKLIRIQNCILYVADIDILDQTPLLDVKPYVPKFDCFEVERLGWLAAGPPVTKFADDRFCNPKTHESKQ
jgi:tRNA-Thr(GGU) m(6)t(6)A37 methyltransferase TsaA